MTKLLHIKIFILVILITLAKVDLYAQTVLSSTEDVCAGELKQYKVEGLVGSRIYWSVQGGVIYDGGSLVIDQDLATPGFQFSELIVSGESLIGILWNVSAGNYLVKAYEETASLCVSSDMELTVTVSNLPDQSLTLSDPSICPGGTAAIILTNSESGVNYQLRLNSDNSLVGSAIAGTGGNVVFNVTPLINTIYNVFAENSVSSCGVELDDKSNVTVEDVVNPTAVCQSITIQLNTSGTASIVASQIDNGSTDNCTAVASLGFSLDKTNFTCADLGANNVILTVTDATGNTSTCNAIVTVEDLVDPVTNVASLSAIDAQCEVTSLTAPTATDNCDGALIGTHVTTLPITSSTVVTWTYTDASGNTATQTQNVDINDTIDPVIPTLADVTGECSATAISPTTTDNCAGVITGTTSDALTYTTQGTHVIAWSFTDGNGNSIIVNQNVIISDVTSPVLADLSDLSIVDCAEDESVIPQVKSFTGMDIQAARYTDNCTTGFVVEYQIQLPNSSYANAFGVAATGANSLSDPSGFNFPEGVSIIHFRVLDASGNISNVKTYTVTVNHKPIPSGIIY